MTPNQVEDVGAGMMLGPGAKAADPSLVVQGSSVAPTVNQDLLQKAQTFLDGTLNNLSNYMSGGANDSGNNISTQPQNTDLGSYDAPGTSYQKLNYAISPQFKSSTKAPLG
jgi:hypothetical protein